MASASATTRGIEDMFWEHIKANSHMRGKWLYFGTNDYLLRATLALLPNWNNKYTLILCTFGTPDGETAREVRTVIF